MTAEKGKDDQHLTQLKCFHGLIVASSPISSTYLLHIIIISFTQPITGGQEASSMHRGCIQDKTNAERKKEKEMREKGDDDVGEMVSR